MKKGFILYVTEGKNALQDTMDLDETRNRLGADRVCLATSESDIAYGWWKMMTQGVHTVFCVRAAYSEAQDAFEIQGTPLRLYG
jgi:Zn ribbon nucleic-acid-binding protein